MIQRRIFLIVACFCYGLSFLPSYATQIPIRILGVNDFHGQLGTGRMYLKRPVGGAAVLAAYLKHARQGKENQTIITLMGDQVGASGPTSGLLNDEPSILFFNQLANDYCQPDTRFHPQCNMVATPGNHEFDKGQAAMFRLIQGAGDPPTNRWINLDVFPGANFPYVSANIVDSKTNQPIFKPYVIKYIQGVPIAFIGALTQKAPASMLPSSYKGIKFLDEAEAINSYVDEIKAQGVHTFVVLIHTGGYQKAYDGQTQSRDDVIGDIKDIVYRLDDAIDVVMAGHTHRFLNAYLKNQHGKKMLVTQANSYSQAFAQVDLQIDSTTLAVTNKTAQIITTHADIAPGNQPDAAAQALLSLAENSIAPTINEYIGTSLLPLLKYGNQDGESNLGDLIADALRVQMHTDFAITNPSGIRNNVAIGDITWGMLFSVLPFGNETALIKIKGESLYQVMEQQWIGDYPIMLQISGFEYSYSLDKPLGHRVLSMTQNHRSIQREKWYTLATNRFLATSGVRFSALKQGKIIKMGRTGLELVVDYIKQLPQPFSQQVDGRIHQVIYTQIPSEYNFYTSHFSAQKTFKNSQ